ncbi:Sh2 domain-containing adapter protein d [Plakobranchus ocellatus]|uniref:Sh2 domain-containing adapter protein d n=1 Tax=Plakobranchus ocellatus TaxID=259542 RepID=A0AAV3Z7P8_9GAST|nr:Sh2 domain-containing adapter protein d [Plakobranchus ocellatus]
MSSDNKKEFLQKYMLDSYSRAIPTNALSGKSAALGEYCDPVDSYKGQSRRRTEDSEDSDPGYALPQDAIDSIANQKNVFTRQKQSLDENDGDVYELAKNPDVAASKKSSPKPSPLPRKSTHRKSQVTDAVCSAQVTTAPPNDNAVASVPSQEASARCRPSKKVVEIDYEVVSDIRPSKPGTGSSSETSSQLSQPSSHKDHSKNTSDVVAAGSSGMRKISSTHYPVSTKVTPPTPPFQVTQGSKQDFEYSMSQPATNVPSECLYEEPWDLKAKRLKQQEENRASMAAMSKGEVSVAPPGMAVFPSEAKAESVYEDAWDSATQQRKLEAIFKRSLSTTSETSEIFHDALDNLPGEKGLQPDSQPEKATEPALKPVPTNTYEDAWDLKNSIIQKQIRDMQVQASATYEEPWDLKKQHRLLGSRLSANVSSTGPGTSSQGSSKVTRQWSSSDVNSKPRLTASSIPKKQHSFEDSSRSTARLRGSNIGQRVNPKIPLANQNWYHGNITRDDAEKMLRVCKEGSYIVRISSDRRSYSLSIKSAKQNIHVQIEQVGHSDGSVRYILGKNSKEFCSIPEMIDYYTHHRVPLRGAEHITLLHPVECKWSSNNSQ